MKCMIECSFGEIIDKLTILHIKKEKITNKESLNNVCNEYDMLQEIRSKHTNDTLETLFSELLEINNKLWSLEDRIRVKSKHLDFDQEYIDICESIHTTNDLRYQVKRTINKTFDSNLCEEKTYSIDN